MRNYDFKHIRYDDGSMELCVTIGRETFKFFDVSNEDYEQFIHAFRKNEYFEKVILNHVSPNWRS